MIKKAIAVFLVAGSFVFAALVLFGNKSTIPSTIPPTDPKTAVRNETLPQKSTASNEKFQENSTQKIAKSVARELVKSEKLTTGMGSINPNDLISGILPDLQKSFDFQDLNPEVKISDLRVVKGSDKTLAENYFKNLRAIIKANFSDLTADFSQPSAKDFELTALAYQKMAAAVYGLIIPENLIEIHREEIRLLTLHQKIFESLARYQDDPLKALASAEILQKTGPQLENLANMKLIFIKNNDLNI